MSKKGAYWSTLGEVSSDDSSEDERAHKAEPSRRVSIRYEDLQAHGHSGGPSVLEMPDPEAAERERKRAEAEAVKAKEEAEKPPEYVPLIKNAFGKWQYEGTDPRRKRMADAEGNALEEEPPKKLGPSLRDKRAQVLQDQAEAIVAHQEKFNVDRLVGSAASDKDREAEARRKIKERQLQEARAKAESIRQKNKRKQKLGQATFTLKDSRDCPDLHRS